MDDWRTTLERDGYALLEGAFSPAQVALWARDLEEALSAAGEGGPAIRGSEGIIYAARNVLTLWPKARSLWRGGLLGEALAVVLGPGLGLVRVLYFDKPPGQSWALPWHKDVTIAVRD